MFPEDLNELRRYFIFDTNLDDNSILDDSVSIYGINDILSNPNISEEIKSLFRRLMQLKLEILSHFQFFRSPTG